MQHHVRVVLDLEPYGGVFSPVVRLFLTGPNGSPAGTGPKAWPRPLRWLDRSRLSGWSNSLEIPVPHLKWKHPMSNMRLSLYQRTRRYMRRFVGGNGHSTRTWDLF